MANNTLTGTYTDDYLLTDTTTLSATATTDEAVTAFNEKVKLTLSNYPLAVVNDVVPATVVTEVVVTNSDNTLLTRSLTVTFETIYKNLASLPSTTDMSNNKYLTQVYTLPDLTTITVVVDMLTPGLIVTTISGNTGYTSKLVKTTTYVKHVTIDVTYSLGAENV